MKEIRVNEIILIHVGLRNHVQTHKNYSKKISNASMKRNLNNERKISCMIDESLRDASMSLKKK